MIKIKKVKRFALPPPIPHPVRGGLNPIPAGAIRCRPDSGAANARETIRPAERPTGRARTSACPDNSNFFITFPAGTSNFPRASKQPRKKCSGRRDQSYSGTDSSRARRTTKTGKRNKVPTFPARP